MLWVLIRIAAILMSTHNIGFYVPVHVLGNDVVEFKYPLAELLISDTNFEKAVTEIKECWWLLASKNAVVQSLKLQRHRYVHFGYNPMHLTVWLCWLLA